MPDANIPNQSSMENDTSTQIQCCLLVNHIKAYLFWGLSKKPKMSLIANIDSHPSILFTSITIKVPSFYICKMHLTTVNPQAISLLYIK